MRPTDKPVSITSADDNNRILVQPYEHEWEHDGTTYKVIVPEGFKYRPTTTFLPRSAITLFWGRYALEDESCAHDFTWKEDRHWEDGELVTGRPVPKDASDALLLETDHTALGWLAWALSMSVGWLLWHDVFKKMGLK